MTKTHPMTNSVSYLRLSNLVCVLAAVAALQGLSLIHI